MNLKVTIRRYWNYLVKFGPRITYFYLLYPRYGGAKAIVRRHYEIKRYIKHEFKNIFEHYRNIHVEPLGTGKEKHPIWVCWLQGEENMPEIIRICYKSILKHAAGNSVNLITEQNLQNYIEVPDFVNEYLRQGKISRTHYADYIRIMLLAKYGGMWIDASILVTGDIANETQRAFYTVRQKEKVSISYVSEYRWAVSLIGCSRNYGRYMFSCLNELFNAYLQKRTFFIDFFLFDYFIAAMYEELPIVKQLIDSNEYNCDSFYLMAENMNNKYDKAVMQAITRQGKFHKLSWKHEYIDTDNNNNQTLFNHIKNMQ